ncbi:MAG: ester cyclase family protein [Thermomicrobiales bacterium]
MPFIATRRSLMQASAGLLLASTLPLAGPSRSVVARASPTTAPGTMQHALEVLYVQGWNAHNPEAVRGLFTADHHYHDPYTPGIGPGPQGYVDLLTFYLAAFPDIDFPIHDIVIGSDAVGVRWTATGTQQGPVLGIPPTNRAIALPAMAIHTFTGDLISSTVVIYDGLGLLQQMGVIPVTASGDATPTAMPATVPEPAIPLDGPLPASPVPSQSPDQAVAATNAFYNEVWNQHEPGRVSDFVTPSFTYVDPAVPTLPPGPDAYATFVAGFKTGMPDFRIAIDTIAANGNAVAVHWVGTGTQTGEFLGVPPTGKTVTTEAMAFLHFDGTLISANHWSSTRSGVLMQLGVIRPLGGGASPEASPAG